MERVGYALRDGAILEVREFAQLERKREIVSFNARLFRLFNAILIYSPRKTYAMVIHHLVFNSKRGKSISRGDNLYYN